MTRVCPYCKTPLADDMQFCPGCGRKLLSVRTEERKAPEKPKSQKSTTSSGTKTLNIILTVTMVIQLAVVGWWYPGILRKKPEQGKPGGNESIVNLKQDATGSLSSINITYSEKEIANAKKETAVVSSDHSLGTAGEVSVEFDSWNLPKEDTLVVRTLPVKEDPNTGFTIHAYDFSMESGTDEFMTPVTIQIPRTVEEGQLGMCVAYNEESGEWEYVCQEISEDGKYYNLYTDHFCPKGEAVLSGHELKGLNDLGINSSAIMGYFFVSPRDMYDANMNMPVQMWYPSLFTYLERTYQVDLGTLADAMEKNEPETYPTTLPAPDLLQTEDVSVNLATIVEETYKLNSMKQYKEWFNKSWLHTKVTNIASGSIYERAGIALSILGMYGTYLKVSDDVIKGKTWWDAALQHKADIVGAGATSYGLVIAAMKGSEKILEATAASNAIAAAVVGLTMFAISYYYSQQETRTLSIPEEIYRDYYTDQKGNSRTFLYNIDKDNQALSDYGLIQPLQSLTDEENEQLQHLINQPMENDDGGVGLKGIDPIRLKAGEIDYKWSRVISFLYDTCFNTRPERFSEVIREFYRNYASAAYARGLPAYNSYALKDIANRGEDPTVIEIVPDDNKRNAYIDAMTNDLYVHHMKLHKSYMKKYQAYAEEKVYDLVEHELIPVLNRQIVFTVTDESLKNPEDLSKSDYGIDYTQIKENKEILSGSSDIPYAKVISTMKFAISTNGVYIPVSYPFFTPYRSYRFAGKDLFNGMPKEYYSPYTDIFLPRVNGDNNEIFRCTYYHYLMMGAPQAILFKNVKDKDSVEVPLEFTSVSEGTDGVIYVNTAVNSAVSGDWYLEEIIYPDYVNTCDTCEARIAEQRKRRDEYEENRKNRENNGDPDSAYVWFGIYCSERTTQYADQKYTITETYMDCSDMAKEEPKVVTYDPLPFTIDSKWVDQRMAEQMKSNPDSYYVYDYYFEAGDGYDRVYITFLNGKNQKKKTFEDLLAEHPNSDSFIMLYSGEAEGYYIAYKYRRVKPNMNIPSQSVHINQEWRDYVNVINQ